LPIPIVFSVLVRKSLSAIPKAKLSRCAVIISGFRGQNTLFCNIYASGIALASIAFLLRRETRLVASALQIRISGVGGRLTLPGIRVRPARGEIIMARNNRSTVIGVFDLRTQAHHAVEELRQAGFADSDITMVMHHDDKTVDVTDMDAAKAAQVSGENKAGEGAAIGVIAGGLGGGAVALAMGLIPGVGPVLSFGTLAAQLFGVGAAVGAAGGGIVGALIGADFPEEEARFYERELKAGRVLVGVSAGDRADEARAILDRCGGYHALSHVATAAAPGATFPQ
jgi:hypothetical protein